MAFKKDPFHQNDEPDFRDLLVTNEDTRATAKQSLEDLARARGFNF